jgi:hypothetical protein
MIISSIVTGRIMAKMDRYKILGIIGASLMLAGTIILSLVRPQTPEIVIFISLAFIGAGIGISNPVYTVTGQSGFPRKIVGSVTSTLQFFRNLGGVMGSSLFGFVMATTMKLEMMKLPTGNLSPEMNQLINNPRSLTDARLIGQISAKLSGDSLAVFSNLVSNLKIIFSDSLRYVFITGLIISLITLVITVFMRNVSINREKPD